MYVPTFGIEVFTTDLQTTSGIRSEARALGLGVVEVVEAPLSLNDLDRAQSAVSRLIPTDASTYTDIRTGTLVIVSEAEFTALRPSDLEGLDADARAALEQPGLRYRWEQGSSEPTVNLYGGLDIGSCSSGFAVKKGSTYGVTTAGHCTGSMSYGGSGLTFQAEKYVHQGKHDIEWHSKAGSHTIRNWVTDGTNDATTYYRTITSVQTSAGFVTGQWVCKWGQTTRYNCGTVTSVTYDPSYPNVQLYDFGLVERSGVDLSEPGDSGGPVYAENQAVGTISGQSGNRLIFYPAHRMAWSTSIGVTILTS